MAPPKRCTLLRIDSNQGISGYGEVRDASSKTYALMLKSRILGENPCNVDKIFRKIKQFGGPSRQGGGVSGIPNPLFENGFIKVPEKPGLGFDDLNEEVLRQYINPNIPGYFEPTEEWNREFSNDRIWS